MVFFVLHGVFPFSFAFGIFLRWALRSQTAQTAQTDDVSGEVAAAVAFEAFDDLTKSAAGEAETKNGESLRKREKT